MARQVKASRATAVSEDAIPDGAKQADKYEPLARWVLARVDSWTTWRDSNYKEAWDKYERLWRGIFNEQERMRASERAMIVTPALSEAVENAAAELEEAVFGRGADYFDLQGPSQPVEEPPALNPMAQAVGAAAGAPQMPGMGMPMPGMGANVQQNAQPAGLPPGLMDNVAALMGTPAMSPEEKLDMVRANLKEDLANVDFAAETVKAIIYAAVFGSGFGEIELKEVVHRVPDRAPDGELVVRTEKHDAGALRALNPRNCVWDPNAERLADGLGFAIVEKVSKHKILEAQKSGVYRDDIDLLSSPVMDDETAHGDEQLDGQKAHEFNAKQVRWWGLVPKSLLNAEEGAEVAGADNFDYLNADDELVEAYVVIINDGVTAKAVKNPYTRKDRPIVEFPWDIVPGRLLGRGIAEKGASSQQILDAEVRARLDSLALVTAPMMGMDANRMPRGFKFKIKPGGSVLTNGRPSEVMEPFKFGQLDSNHWQNVQDLRAMVGQATGSVDAAALAASASDARSGAMSMAMAPIIKRYKRTLVHFLDRFMMPAVEKIVWRNMQFSKKRYPEVDFKLRAASTMGIMQREYETQQLTSLLSTMQQGTPEYNAILGAIVSNTSIPNREQILKMVSDADERAAAQAAAIQQAQQDPMLEQLKQVSSELAIAEKQAEIAKLRAQTAKLEQEAVQVARETELMAMDSAMKGIYSLPQEQQEAARRARTEEAKLLLDSQKLDEAAAERASNERIASMQVQGNLAATRMKINAGGGAQ